MMNVENTFILRYSNFPYSKSHGFMIIFDFGIVFNIESNVPNSWHQCVYFCVSRFSYV